MTNGYSVSSLAGTVVPIMGMGIGLTMLAHTAKNITKITDSTYNRPKRRPRSPPRLNTRRRPYKKQQKRLPSYYRPRRVRTIPIRSVSSWKF